MKRIIALGALLLPVVTIYGASSRFFASGVQRSNYWKATQSTPVEGMENFTSGEDEEFNFTSGEDELEEQGEDEHTAPVGIDEELLIDEQEEQAEPVEIDEEAEQSAEEIEEQAELVGIGDEEAEESDEVIEEQVEEIEGES